MSEEASTPTPRKSATPRKGTASRKSTQKTTPARKTAKSTPAAATAPVAALPPEALASTEQASPEGGRRSATVNLPFVTAEFRVPDMHVPSWESLPVANRLPRPHVPETAGRQVVDAGRAVGSFLPDRKETALFVGLAAAAAAGALQWPVAVAVAAGTEVARRTARTQSSAPHRQPATTEAG